MDATRTRKAKPPVPTLPYRPDQGLAPRQAVRTAAINKIVARRAQAAKRGMLK